MRRVLAVILLMLAIGETTSLNQLVKLPILYAHFIEHNNLDPNVDFLTYIVRHYIGDDFNDHDDDRDMQLPFKKFEHQNLTFIYTLTNKVVPHNQCWDLRQAFAEERPKVYFDPAPAGLFRPPRG